MRNAQHVFFGKPRTPTIFIQPTILHLIPSQFVLPCSFTRFCLLSSCALHVWCNEEICRLNIAADGAMILREEAQGHLSGTAFLVTLNPHSVIWNMAMVLRISTNDSTNRTLIVLKDSLDKVSFQRLRVSLLWVRQHQLSNKHKKSQIHGNF